MKRGLYFASEKHKYLQLKKNVAFSYQNSQNKCVLNLKEPCQTLFLKVDKLHDCQRPSAGFGSSGPEVSVQAQDLYIWVQLVITMSRLYT